MFKHILYPTDGSVCALRAGEIVKQEAKKNHSKVTILNVYEVSKTNLMHGVDVNEPFLFEINEYLKENSQHILHLSKQLFEDSGLHVFTLSQKGHPEQEIGKAVREHDCDLVIMGVRGHNTTKKILLGPVSHYIIHHTKVPVLLVP